MGRPPGWAKIWIRRSTKNHLLSSMDFVETSQWCTIFSLQMLNFGLYLNPIDSAFELKLHFFSEKSLVQQKRASHLSGTFFFSRQLPEALNDTSSMRFGFWLPLVYQQQHLCHGDPSSSFIGGKLVSRRRWYCWYRSQLLEILDDLPFLRSIGFQCKKPIFPVDSLWDTRILSSWLLVLPKCFFETFPPEVGLNGEFFSGWFRGWIQWWGIRKSWGLPKRCTIFAKFLSSARSQRKLNPKTLKLYKPYKPFKSCWIFQFFLPRENMDSGSFGSDPSKNLLDLAWGYSATSPSSYPSAGLDEATFLTLITTMFPAAKIGGSRKLCHRKIQVKVLRTAGCDISPMMVEKHNGTVKSCRWSDAWKDDWTERWESQWFRKHGVVGGWTWQLLL